MKKSQFWKNNRELCGFINNNFLIRVYQLGEAVTIRGAGKLPEVIGEETAKKVYEEIRNKWPNVDIYTWHNRKHGKKVKFIPH